MRYVFIINPAAGKREKYLDFVPKIEEFFKGRKEDYKILFSKKRGDAGDKARKEAETGDEVLIVACGGEGTMFEILNGVAGYDNVTLSVAPIGSANDFLKSFGNEYKEKFFDLNEILDGFTIPMDVIKADEFYCLNGCSVGMDAVVARDMALFKNWPLVSGPMAYKLAIIKTFLGKIGVKLQLSIDDKPPVTQDLLFAVVGNGPVYGGGYYATPKALPYDGHLDFTTVKKISKLKIPFFLKDYENGNCEKFSFCSTGVCQKLSFKANKPLPINLDGEIFERAEMHFQILKDFIKFRLPKSLSFIKEQKRQKVLEI